MNATTVAYHGYMSKVERMGEACLGGGDVAGRQGESLQTVERGEN